MRRKNPHSQKNAKNRLFPNASSLCHTTWAKLPLCPSLPGTHRLVGSSRRRARRSNAPTQSSEHDLCLRLCPSTRSAGCLTATHNMPVVTWCTPWGDTLRFPHTSGECGPGGIPSSCMGTSPIIWVAQTCSLWHVAATRRHSRPDRRHE